MLEDLTPDQRAVLEPPYAGAFLGLFMLVLLLEIRIVSIGIIMRIARILVKLLVVLVEYEYY